LVWGFEKVLWSKVLFCGNLAETDVGYHIESMGRYMQAVVEKGTNRSLIKTTGNRIDAHYFVTRWYRFIVLK
jgi:hypothetical protein